MGNPAHVSVAIMAHPDRRLQAEALSARYDASITWDRFNSRWDTGRRAWLSLLDAPPATTHGLVLQDDSIPCRGFLSGLPSMLAHVPDDSPVVLYAGRTHRWNQTFWNVSRNASFLVMDRIWWGPGIILPMNLIGRVIEAGDQLASSHDQYDHMLGSFFHANSIPVYYTWPSLVNHSTKPSLVDGRTSKRRAYYYATRPVARYRWDGRVVKVETPPAAERGYLGKGRSDEHA